MRGPGGPRATYDRKGLILEGVIYKVTYPNGKVYIGQDRTNDINYFGSAYSAHIAADFKNWHRQKFVIGREILAVRRHVSIQELNRLEREFIAKHRSDDPKRGYNRNRRGKQ